MEVSLVYKSADLLIAAIIAHLDRLIKLMQMRRLHIGSQSNSCTVAISNRNYYKKSVMQYHECLWQNPFGIAISPYVGLYYT
jgi:hypothetical protein